LDPLVSRHGGAGQDFFGAVAGDLAGGGGFAELRDFRAAAVAR
jgi:hypothetical protein